MIYENRYMSHVSLISPRTTTYEDVLLVNWSWPRWPQRPHCPPLLATGIHCTTPDGQCLCTNMLYLGQTSALIWRRSRHQLVQHSVEGSLLIRPLIFFLSSTPWKRHWRMMQDWSFVCLKRTWWTDISLLLVGFQNKTVFFPYVFNDAQCWTRNRTYCQNTRQVQVPWSGLQ